jgi:hypothetical protein
MKLFKVMLLLLILPAILPAQEQENLTENKRAGFFVDVGFGGGVNIVDAEKQDDSKMNFTLGIETKVGGHINNNLSIFLLTHLNIFSLETVSEFSDWVFDEEGPRILLAICIPFTILLDSQILIGPGLIYHTSSMAPSFFIEGGVGFSSVQSVANDTFVFGVGIFTGLGVEITNDLSCGLRIIWFPSFFFSKWTPSQDNYLTIVGFIYF